MGTEKRRSDRIMFTIPVAVHGTDPDGQPFEAGGRTITLNRHGARVQVSRPLHTGQIVRVINQNNQSEADFRAVGPVSPPTEKVGEWGMECIEDKENIWGIYFPPPTEDSQAKALLECRKCHFITLTPLSLVELEVLQTAGILSRSCEHCGTDTPWGCPEKQITTDSSLVAAAVTAAPEAAAPVAERRQELRATVQALARVRDYYGGCETVQTENMSKDGFCFSSEKNYHLGQGIMVVCPFGTADQNIETRSRIVYQSPVKGSNRWIYGVHYERPAA